MSHKCKRLSQAKSINGGQKDDKCQEAFGPFRRLEITVHWAKSICGPNRMRIYAGCQRFGQMSKRGGLQNPRKIGLCSGKEQRPQWLNQSGATCRRVSFVGYVTF